MIKKLTYDEYFDKAMQHVFGKTLICRDIDVAAKYAKSENLDCITMEGMFHFLYFKARTDHGRHENLWKFSNSISWLGKP